MTCSIVVLDLIFYRSIYKRVITNLMYETYVNQYLYTINRLMEFTLST